MTQHHRHGMYGGTAAAQKGIGATVLHEHGKFDIR